MLMWGKRGQTEDFIGDLIPAIVLVAIGLIIASFLSSSHTSDVEAKVNLAAVAFNGMDIFAFFHMPVEGYGNLAGLLTVIAEAYEKKDKAFFESGAIASLGQEYSVCGADFESIAGKFFENKLWAVYVFEVIDKDVLNQKKVFECRHLGVDPEENMKFSDAYLPASGFTAYHVLVGWKDE